MIGARTALGLIPARGGSKGIRRKNLRPVGGLPLLAWTARAALASRYLDQVVVSSEDPEIIAVARDHGCASPFVRPAALAQDETPAVDVALHALEALTTQFDYLVLLQPTSPLRTAEDIDGALAICEHRGAPACVSVTLAREHPNWMYHLGEDGCLMPLLGDAAPAARRQDLPTLYLLNGAIYVTRRDWLRQQRSFVGQGTLAYPMPWGRSVDIDTEEDLRYLDFLLAQRPLT